jgi:MFS family permease
MLESINYHEPRSGDVEKGFASDPDDDIHAIPDSGIATPISEKDTTTLSIQLHQSHATQSLSSSSLLSRIWKFLTYKSNTLSDPDTSPPPDGGIRAWIVVVMSLMAGFNSFGLLNAYGVFQTYYVSMLHLPPSTISWIGSMQGFLLMFVSGPSGRLTDAGYFHQTLFIGTFLQLLGLFGASFSTKYWQIMLSHGICAGIGGGLVFCPTLSLVGTYFSKNRSLALAICAIGNSFGGLIFAGILESLLPKVGFAWSMRVVGFVLMNTMVPANFLLKPRRILRVKASLVDWSAFKEPVYATFLVGMFFTMLGMWVPVFYVCSPPPAPPFFL